MFIGRQRELSALTEELSNWKKRTAVLVYGKRRVGKSTLIREAAKSFDGVVINYLCVTSTFEGNLELIYRAVSDALALPNIKFDSLFAMMDYLKTLDKKKQFYEISDNLMRFYFSFIFGKTGTIARIDEMQFYSRNIEEVLGQFISRRFEGIALQYFDRPMTLEECEQEKEQLEHIQGIDVAKIGFVCSGGFNFKKTHEFILIDGDCLYHGIC